MRIRVFAVAVFCSLALLLVLLVPVNGHSVIPISSSPADGEVLLQSPGQVYLAFPEEVSEDGSTLQVFDAQGKQVDLGKGGVDLNDFNHTGLVVKLPPLGQGVYLVKWKIALSDGDSSQGQYYFGLGNVTLPQNQPLTDGQAGTKDAPTEQQIGVSPATWALLVTGVAILVAVSLFYYSRNKGSTKP